ncbi:MAG: hypothetical protein U0136_02265 [Bdellovibrionota bacterium]
MRKEIGLLPCSRLLVAVWIMLAATPRPALSAPACGSTPKEVAVDTKTATAATWSNFRKSEGSLAYESEKMLSAANQNAAKASPPAELCSGGCSPSVPPLVVFRSVPNKFLSDYSDSEKCNKLLTETKARPLRFPNREFSSLAELNEWFGEFSQGKGKDGSALYAQCDGACSPQYTCLISQSGGKLHVDAEVICGPARDKDENLYKLSYGYRWSCQTQ